jgi:tetratricopeptide (TPR) repeat protein
VNPHKNKLDPQGEPVVIESAKKVSDMKTKRITGWRLWIFRGCLVILPLFLLCFLEVTLRLCGYGHPTAFFIRNGPKDSYRTNEKFGWRFFTEALARESVPAVLTTKQAGTIRIFVLGESAAQGFPDPAFSFGRILEVMLQDQYPGTRFEIINAAMTAINSHVVREIARECAEHEPDIFIIYTGNNEIVGPYGPGTVFRKWSPNLTMIKGSIWAKSLRIGQLLEAGMARVSAGDRAPTKWEGMAMFLNKTVTLDDPRLESVYGNFRQNLIDLCRTAHRAGAAVVLSTVAVNLKDCPPLASLHKANLPESDIKKWETLYREGTELEAANKNTEALEKYQMALQIDDRFAEMHFRMGRIFAAQGKLPEAQERFILARDLDALRFRADSRINATIREVATALKTEGVNLVDSEKFFFENGLPGKELFYEHVHLNFDGNYFLARQILNKVSEALPKLTRHHTEALSRQQCAEKLAFTALEESKMWEDMFKGVTSKPPFTFQFDHSARLEEETEHLKSLLEKAANPKVLRDAKGTYDAALARAPDDWQLHGGYANLAMKCGRPDVAAQHRKMIVDLFPWDAREHNDLGMALADENKTEEAIAQYQEAIRLKPNFPEAINNLGNAMAKQGKPEEALTYFREAIRRNPDYPNAHFNMAVTLAGQSRNEEAITAYREALRLNPDYLEAHHNMGNALLNLGFAEEAIAHYNEALRIMPQNPKARINLAVAFTRQGRNEKAIAQYKEILLLSPNSPEAHNNLGNALLKQGRADEAVAQFQEAIRLLPAYPDAHMNLGKALQQSGKLSEAIAHFAELLQVIPAVPENASVRAEFIQALASVRGTQESIEKLEQTLRMNPEDAEAHNILGNLYRQSGRTADAIEHFEVSLKLKPKNAAARFDLGITFQQAGRLNEAIRNYSEALKINPDHILSLNRLAWLFSTNPEQSLRDAAKAVTLAEHACLITARKEVKPLDTLAAAYAEAGQFTDAISTAEKGLALAKAAKEQTMADEIQARLTLYRAGKPYREAARPEAPAASEH